MIYTSETCLVSMDWYSHRYVYTLILFLKRVLRNKRRITCLCPCKKYSLFGTIDSYSNWLQLQTWWGHVAILWFQYCICTNMPSTRSVVIKALVYIWIVFLVSRYIYIYIYIYIICSCNIYYIIFIYILINDYDLDDDDHLKPLPIMTIKTIKVFPFILW